MQTNQRGLTRRDTSRIRPICGEFEDAALEERYWLASTEHHARWAEVATLIGVGVYLLFVIADAASVGVGARWAGLAILRVCLSLPGVAFVAALRRRPSLIRRHGLVSSLEALMLGSYFSVALLQPDSAGIEFLSVGLIMMAMFVLVPNRLLLVTAVTLGGAVVWVSLTTWQDGASAGVVVPRLMILFATIAVGFVAANQNGRVRREEFALRLREQDANHQMAAEIDRRQAVEGELLRRANVDLLTGTATRRHFLEQAGAEIHRAQRTSQPLSVLVLDLDHFKVVNDRHGHPAGDEVLAGVSRLVLEHVRRVDIVGRMGGEEFAIVMPGADVRKAEEVALRLRAAVSGLELRFATGTVRPTISVGLTELDVWTDTIDDGLARADRALYTAKSEGRNRVVPT